MAMSTAQKNLLTRNRVHLVNNIHPAAVCDYLREDHHITESMQEDIMVCVHVIVDPSPPLDNIQVMVIVWRLRGNIIRTALCWIV